MGRRRLGVALLVPPPYAAQIDTLRSAVGDGSLHRIPPHLTLVPPVNVRDERVGDAADLLRTAAAAVGPLRLTLGPAATFLPDNAVLFLTVSGADLDGVTRLRDFVFRPPLEREVTWPFVPHITLADEAEPGRIAAAQIALADYCVDVVFDHIHLLREDDDRVWRPIAGVRLGPSAVVGRGGLALEITEGDRLDPTAGEFTANAFAAHDVERGIAWERRPLALTARRDGMVVGTAVGWVNGSVGYLSELIVEAAARGEGIGAHLLAAFESAVRRRGAQRLALTTAGIGGAQRFYERHGWRVESVLSDWVAGDLIQMRKD